ncbi:MAG: hypothetical protein FWB76_01815 [Oscillospiraceae bacterium]|nr:hypothetical protein [Oscillospiraceae bacterium]
MAKEKITVEQFLASVSDHNTAFVQHMHEHLLANGCKAAFDEQKNGYLAAYKFGKPPKAFMNFLFRKQGMLTRVYGEHISHYPDFLNALPPGMVQAIASSGDCKRLISGGCSPKCTGYDFTIGDAHFQKCRYNCFEFLVADETKPFIAQFVELELAQRQQPK